MKKLINLLPAILLAFFSLQSNTSFSQPVLWQCNQCAVVTNLTATNITNTSVDLSWNHPGGHCGFIVDAINNATGSVTTYNVPPSGGGVPLGTTITGLSPLTSYTFWVRQVFTPHPDDPLVDCAPEDVTIYTTGDGIGCDCDYVFDIQINHVTNTTADITWQSNAACQDFYVTITDMNNPSNSWVYVVTGATNYQVTGLTAGGFYKVWVRVISNSVPGVDCIPEEEYFSTDHAGIDCWDCVPPTNVNINNITQNSATVTWTPGSACNDFIVYITDDLTFATQMFYVTGTSYTFTGLLPSRSYTVMVALNSVQIPGVSCLPEGANFSTLHCGNFTQSLTHYVETLILGNPGNGLVFNSQQPYMSTPNAFNLSQGVNYLFGFDHRCLTGTPSGTVYANMWFDLNNDGIFGNSAGETVINQQFSHSGGALYTSRAGGSYTAPNQTYNNVKGRCIISFNNAGPCGPVSNGQVLDFIVNIQ